MKKIMTLFATLLLFVACEVEPKPINYGSDSCDYCSMTIVDRQHSAELVTTKGRAYKFDAIECMVNYDREHTDVPVELYLTANFDAPGELIDATKASFLKSDELSSPMGANLSAFAKRETAEKMLQQYGGEIYDWNGIKDLKDLPGIAR